MTRHLLTICLVAGAAVLFGCGGNEPAPVARAPGPTPGGQPLDVGPMLVRPASAAGFTAQDLGSQGPCSLVALYGSQIDYMASQALLDRIVFSSNRDG